MVAVAASGGVLDLAIDVHGQLLRLVAPASPSSIRASSLRPSNNPALFAICTFALVSLLVFALPFAIEAGDGVDSRKQLMEFLRVIGAAGLGSSYYALFTASDYIKTSTFDPKYNNVYLIRCGLGLLSGLILAYFLKEFLAPTQPTPATGGASTLDVRKVSLAALALLGGYAAEAVAQILNRVSDTLIALFSGSDKDKVGAAKQKAEAEVARKTLQLSADTAKKLSQAATESDPARKALAIQQVIDDLLKPK